jgi:hypothetical protein
MTGLRAAFHVHSDWSYDGRVPLPELAALFAAHRYDAVFICEHDRGFSVAHKQEHEAACAEASRAGALLIPGIEYAGPDDHLHVPVWGPVPFLGEGVPTVHLLTEVSEHGGAAVIAHPRRHDAWRMIDPAWLPLAVGIEIWTRKWDGWAPNRWAVAQAERAGLVPVVSLDLHRRNQMFPLAMELELAGPVTPVSCVEALVAGRARPLVGGLSVRRLTHGHGARAAAGVETIRRPLWRQGRTVRERLRSDG